MTFRTGRGTTLTFERTSSCKISDAKDGPRFPKELSEKNEGVGDLTIVVDGKSTVAHRKVLMESSDYFKTMFEGGFTESSATSIDLSQNVVGVEMSIILDYMYTGVICLSEDNILSVLRTASVFQVTELLASCSEFLIDNVAPSKCMPILIVAETYNLCEVINACVEVIKAWFPFTLCRSPEAIEMPPACLRILIREGVFDLVPDEIKSTFLQNWHQNFRSMESATVSLPKEVKELLPPEDGTEEVSSEDNTKKGSSEDYTKKLSPEDDTKKVSSEDDTKKVSSEDDTKEVCLEDDTKEVSSEDDTKKVSPEDDTKKVSSEDDTKEVSSEDDTKEVCLEDDTKEVSSEDDTKKVSSEDDTKKDSSEDDTKKVSSGDDTKKVSSGDDTKKVSSEDDTKEVPPKDDTKYVECPKLKNQEDVVEEVLLTIMFAPSKKSTQCVTKIHAFNPKLKSWNLVLAHRFGQPVKPKAVPKLVGLTKTTAFFSFFSVDMVYSRECVMAVDLSTKAESEIRVPIGVSCYATDCFSEGGYPQYFVWNDHLCAVFFKKSNHSWAVFQNNHKSKCTAPCKGECWTPLFEVPDVRSDFDQAENQFLTSVFRNDLYLWVKNDTPLGCCLSDMKYFRISHTPNKAKKYKVTQLPAVWAANAKFKEVTTASDLETYFANRMARQTHLGSISLDSQAATMTFHLKMDCDHREPYHKEYYHVYDLTKQEWKEAKFCKIIYPEKLNGALRYVEPEDLSDDEVDILDLFFSPRERHNDDDPYTNPYNSQSQSTQGLCICDYCVRQISPYNTVVWKMEPDNWDCPVVTYLPHALYKFTGFLTYDVRRGFFESLSEAGFQDYSDQMGQSAAAYLSPLESDHRVEYPKQPFRHKKYEQHWGRFWQRSVRTEQS